MALNLNLLRSFWHVGKAGSVSGAARTSFISQPALSKAVRELETQVGLPLLEREARGVRLTEAGQVLFEHANSIFALEREAEDALSSLRSGETGTLRIGASTTISTYYLPALLAQFCQKHPHVRPQLTSDNTGGIEARLLGFELDVALVEGPPHSDTIEKTFWRDDELVLICSPTHPLVRWGSIAPEGLQQFSWLTRERHSGTREVLERALSKWDWPPRNTLEIGSAEAITQGVAAGLGIAFVSRATATEGLALGTVRSVEVRGLDLRRPFYLLRLPKRPRSPLAKAFEEFLGLAP